MFGLANAAAFEGDEPAATGIASKPVLRSLASLSDRSPSMPNQHKGIEMSNSNGPYSRKVRGGQNRNRITTRDFSNWLTEQLRGLTAKEISDLAGCGVRAAENVKQGRNNFMSAHFATLCANSPKIAAAYAEHVGLILPGQAEFAGAFTQAVNAYVRANP